MPEFMLYFSFLLSIVLFVREFVLKPWLSARTSQQLMALKQSMIERGMSPEDIERVLAAGTTPGNELAATS